MVGPCDLMLDISGRFVVVFERASEANTVYFTRFSLEGCVQAHGTLKVPNTESLTKYSKERTATDRKRMGDCLVVLHSQRVGNIWAILRDNTSSEAIPYGSRGTRSSSTA